MDVAIITTLEGLQQQLKAGSLHDCVLYDLDLTTLPVAVPEQALDGAILLGCVLAPATEVAWRKAGAMIFPRPRNLPYAPYRHQLYHWQELASSQEAGISALDERIYLHFSRTRHHPPLLEALYQRIHDHAMDHGLRCLIGFDAQGMTQRPCVGIMGGHSTRRDDPYFLKTAQTAFLLAQAGYLVVSGGGPGIMEAANLGAYFSTYGQEALGKALAQLAQAPHYTDARYQEVARELWQAYPAGGENLAIPTWFYGHEPSNLFATHIAKYFSNSLREDNLLAICLHGIVFAPGSAGTTQEIFQDAAQNHYGTFGYYSPMVFLGRKRYEIDTSLFPLLKQLAWDTPYFDQLSLTDEPEAVLRFIQQHPPKPKSNV
jgi:predicted Rossmann-fold nucleotide-binding protein